MAHTQGRYQQDLGFTDGIVNFAAPDVVAIASAGGPATLVRNGPADIVWNVPVSTTETLSVPLYEGLVLRSGFGEDTMNQFGGTGIAGSAQPQFYRPDIIPLMAAGQELNPRTAQKTKGIKILGLAVKYKVLTANATALTCRLDKALFANGQAVGVTNLLASALNGLQNIFTANPYVTVILIPNALTYQIADLTDLWFELAVQTPGGGTFQFYGVRLLVEFNFN